MVCTPEPTRTDAYGMIKSLLAASRDISIRLLVNMVEWRRKDATSINECSRRLRPSFGIQLAWPDLYGDPTVLQVRTQLPFVSAERLATRRIRAMAARELGERDSDHRESTNRR